MFFLFLLCKQLAIICCEVIAGDTTVKQLILMEVFFFFLSWLCYMI